MGCTTSLSQHSKWKRFGEGIRYFENAVATCLLAAIITVVLVAVFFRYVLANPLSWSGEVATYMFAWLTLLGIAIAQRDHAHVDLKLFAHLGKTVGIALAWFCWTVSVLFFAVLAIAGLLFAAGETVQTGPVSGVPLWIIYASVPTGGILGLYHALGELQQLIRSPLSVSAAYHPEEIIDA